MIFITIVTGAYKPTYNWGGHIIEIAKKHDGFRREFSDGEGFRNMFYNGPNMGIQPMNDGTWNSKVR